MAKTLIKFLLLICLIFSSATQASCDYENINPQIIHPLFKDREYRNFICGDDKCSLEKMMRRLYFEEIKSNNPPYKICLLEPAFNVKNRYTAIFVLEKTGLKFQFVVFNTDIKLVDDHRTKLEVYLDTGGGTIKDTDYIWDGSGFH